MQEIQNAEIALTASAPSRLVMRIDGRTVTGSTNGGWREVLAAYLAQKDTRSEESRRTYRKALTSFFRWTDRCRRELSTLTKTDILDYRDYLQNDKRCSSMTVALYVTALRGFYQWAASEHLCTDITAGVKSHTDKGHIKYHLTRDQRRALLECFADSPRDHAIVNLMLHCGLRTVEVSRANVGDIETVDGRRILYIQGKGRKDKSRWVALMDGAWLPLEKYISTRRNRRADSPLFECEGTNSRGRRLSTRSIQYICKKGLRAIGLDSHRYSAHSLRHTTGVAILENGGSLTDVQDVLGHASVDTSRIYVESARNEMRLRNPGERFTEDLC